MKPINWATKKQSLFFTSYCILFLVPFFLTNRGNLDQKNLKPNDNYVHYIANKDTVKNLPSYITRLTYFGQRAQWSHDGNKILFLAKTYGDAYELTLKTGVIRPVTHHFYHEGFVRAKYLSNGDILLAGAPNFDAENPSVSRHKNAELWILDKNLENPPVPLGTMCSEGPAVSRTSQTIAWAIDDRASKELPEQSTKILMADIKYDDGKPMLVNKEVILDSREHSFRLNGRLETQDFRSPNEKELIFALYAVDYSKADVMGINIETGEITNYTNSDYYEEPEGIYPSGKYTLVESDRHNGRGTSAIDIYRLGLNGRDQMKRLTYFNDRNSDLRATNPAVSDNGKFMIFQSSRSSDRAGVGRGLFLYDFEKAKAEETE